MAAEGLKIVQANNTQDKIMSVGGMVNVMGNKALDQANQAKKKANEAVQNRPEIQGLAAHVRRAWELAKDHRERYVDKRLLTCQRRRNGEYDPTTLQDIRKQGGSEIWMHVTSAKCRAAEAWLRDTLLGSGSEKPWTLAATPFADIPPDVQEELVQKAAAEIEKFQLMNGGQLPADDVVKEFLSQQRDRTLVETQARAAEGVERMERKMEDQTVEGGWLKAFSAFIADLVTYPYAILKGPVVRSRPTLKWEDKGDGQFAPVQGTELRMEWERVSPFDAYWAPHASDPNDGYFIEHHRMTRSELNGLIGVEGYNEEAIREVLRLYGAGGLREWTANTTERETAEGKGDRLDNGDPDGLIDALQFHGSVQGQMLIDWGMDEEQVSDAEREYNVECWLIGAMVIRAKINYDPMGRKPYYKTSYERIPGQFCGNGVVDLIADDQDMCNSAARSLANNMGMASGPQTVINVDRIPDGEDLSQMYPWKVWQVSNDAMGGSAAPISFFTPPSLAAELMGVYEKFSAMADEHSGIARYMQGDTNMGTIGRSATGVTAVMGAASKIIKQVVANVDVDVTQPSMEFLYYYNMRYGDDPDLKMGDIKIKARGAISLIQKEQAMMRRNEFTQMALNNQAVQSLLGMDGMANLLREMAAGLDFKNIDKIIPTAERIKQLQQQAVLEQQALMQQQALAAEQPVETIKANYDENGQFTGADVMAKPQSLPNGAPIANSFAPAGGA